jgi:hypothetical protein
VDGSYFLTSETGQALSGVIESSGLKELPPPQCDYRRLKKLLASFQESLDKMDAVTDQNGLRQVICFRHSYLYEFKSPFSPMFFLFLGSIQDQHYDHVRGLEWMPQHFGTFTDFRHTRSYHRVHGLCRREGFCGL